MPAVLVAAGIAVLSLMEQQHVPTVRINDKLVHAIMYTVLSASILIGWLVNGKRHWKWWMRAVLYSSVYGLLMEALQRFCTLTRSGEMADLLADVIGAVVGTVIVWLISKIINKR